MRIVVVTTFFPNKCDPVRAVFIKYLVKQLKEFADVNVISPVPYVPWFMRMSKKYACLTSIPGTEVIDGVEILRPRFLVLPKIEFLSGIMYAFGILGTVKKILRKDKDVILHTHFAYPDAFGSAMVSKLLNLPLVTTVHGSDINVLMKNSFLRRQILFALKKSDGIISVSSKLTKKMKDAGVFSRIADIPCAGYMESDFSDNKNITSQSKKTYKHILFIGNLFKIKAVDILIEAFQSLINENYILDIVGEGPEKSNLIKLSKKLGIDKKVVFHGRIEHEKIPEILRSSDVLCLPSYNEGTPNVVIESLASGTPVVASDVGALPEIINSKNGFIVPAGNINELSESLRKALQITWDAELITLTAKEYKWEILGEKNYNFLKEIHNEHYTGMRGICSDNKDN